MTIAREQSLFSMAWSKTAFFAPRRHACLFAGVQGSARGNAMRSRNEGRTSIMETPMINYCGGAIEINGQGWPLHKELSGILARGIIHFCCSFAVTVFAQRFTAALCSIWRIADQKSDQTRPINSLSFSCALKIASKRMENELSAVGYVHY